MNTYKQQQDGVRASGHPVDMVVELFGGPEPERQQAFDKAFDFLSSYADMKGWPRMRRGRDMAQPLLCGTWARRIDVTLRPCSVSVRVRFVRFKAFPPLNASLT